MVYLRLYLQKQFRKPLIFIASKIHYLFLYPQCVLENYIPQPHIILL